MTNRENFLSIGRRHGYEKMPVNLNMSPTVAKKLAAYKAEHPDFQPNIDAQTVAGLTMHAAAPEVFLKEYYADKDFKKGTQIDGWGVAHEPGSAAAYHMTYMHHPMENFTSVEQIQSYPFPDFDETDIERMRREVEKIHARGEAAVGAMECTVWETAWYMRGMENLMCDMMMDDDMATVLLDAVTERAIQRIKAYALAGVDGIRLGDDIGMQKTIMMSQTLYGEWIQPRHKAVIDAARVIAPDVLIFYHSCGHVTELIPQLIEAGIDVLDPVQPECMDFRSIHEQFGDRLSFHGTIGTQSVMPFGTPEEVRRKVFENLDIAGKQGGLYVCPTHMLEPEVPLENVLAYIKACEDYTK